MSSISRTGKNFEAYWVTMPAGVTARHPIGNIRNVDASTPGSLTRETDAGILGASCARARQ